MFEILLNPSQQKAADEPLLCRNPPHRQELFVSGYKVSVHQEQFREGLFFRSATLALNLSEFQPGTEGCPAGQRQAGGRQPGHLDGNPGVRTQLLPPELRPQLARHVQPWGSAAGLLPAPTPGT